MPVEGGRESIDTREDGSLIRSVAYAPPHAVAKDVRAALAQIDEFQLLRRLGRGGMGEVWLARDTLLERDVAIKFGLGVMSDEARLRFQIEARAVARLQHPNIVAVHHAGELRGHPFLVTELLQGHSLDALEYVRLEQVVAIGIDISLALAAAHSAGVIHRDVKPANAFLCADGVAKLLDFGLAQLRADAAILALEESETGGGAEDTASGQYDSTQASDSLSGRLAGTPAYMAPETWRREPVTSATDLYSFGALLFALLTGRPPYEGESMGALCEAVLAGRLPDLQAAVPDAPPALVRLIVRCLDLRPDARPRAEEACNELLSIRAAQTSVGEKIGAADAGDPGGNPYRGLLSFGAEHYGLFFGREAEAAAVLTELAGAPFVLIVGASGAGKSSLVRAGVVPQVRAGALGRGPWRIATMVPGERPIERLAQAVAPVLEVTEEEAFAGLRRTPSWVSERLRELSSDGWSVLLCVDQFEECWTLSNSVDRGGLFDALAAVATCGPRVRVVTTLRSDFLGRLDDLGDLRALALRAPVVLGPLSSEGLRRAIVEPARRRGVEVDAAMVELLVERARGAAGMLPLLEFGLGVLWERRGSSQRLVLADLEALGGIEGTLASHAEAALARLPPRLREEAKRMLLALVTVDRTRVRREERELLGSAEGARAALDALINARIVVASAGEEASAYEVAHEILLSGWPRLRDWLEEEAAGREAIERLRRAVSEWERLGRADEALWGARQLDELAGMGAVSLPMGGTEFVAQSLAAQRRARGRRLGLAVAIPVSLALVGGALWGESHARDRAVIAGAITAARALDAEAEQRANAAAETGRRAFAAFEADDLGPGEALWKETLELEEETDRRRREVAATLDRALAKDPLDPVARTMAAEVTLARLLAAERLHKRALLGALEAQLGGYDDGSRAAQLRAPGHVRVETDPPGATLSVARYREDAAGRLVESDATPLAPGERRELEVGSYIVLSEMPGRYPTRYPFLVRRGDDTRLRVVLPRGDDVPEGMVYVPAGRTLYGTTDGDESRVCLAHQPSHEIAVDAFLIARTEVTNAEYVEFLASLPEVDRNERLAEGLTVLPDGRVAWKHRGHVLAPGEPYCSGVEPCVDWSRLPVDGVSREDGALFTAWLARSGRLRGARLCTDREWERAARGADDRRYPAGNGDLGPTDACILATYSGDRLRAGPCAPGTHPASRSPFGVDDLVGSEIGWVADSTDRAHPEWGVLRGGSFLFSGSVNNSIPSRLTNLVGRSSPRGLRVCAAAPAATR